MEECRSAAKHFITQRTIDYFAGLDKSKIDIKGLLPLASITEPASSRNRL